MFGSCCRPPVVWLAQASLEVAPTHARSSFSGLADCKIPLDIGSPPSRLLRFAINLRAAAGFEKGSLCRASATLEHRAFFRSIGPGLTALGGLQVEVELAGIRRAAAAAVELRTLLDRERHMVDVALDFR